MVAQLLNENFEYDGSIIESSWLVEVLDVRQCLYADVGEQRCPLHFGLRDAVLEKKHLKVILITRPLHFLWHELTDR